MPNGDPDWGVKEYPKLEAFFSRISDVLEDFAQQHNLMIDKYYHEFPSWDFLFKHPEGGTGKIEVHKCGTNRVKICLGWWIDDYDNCTRYLKQARGAKCPLNHPALRAALEEMLKVIISWRKEELTPFKSKYYRNWKKHCSKEEFDRQQEKYPVPKLN